MPNPIPTHWYNIQAEFPDLLDPVLDPSSMLPIGPKDYSGLFPESLAAQEFDTRSARVEIPEEVRSRYGLYRPTPLLRARHLEASLGTTCKLFFKYEGTSPIGSHKANSGVAQAYYAAQEGFRRCIAETGAGQWGSAISMGSRFFGLDCLVYMVKNSYASKPSRRILMETFGSKVLASPSLETGFGSECLAKDPGSQGSLGIAIAEAIETAKNDPKAVYSLGSALNFVCLHQTVVGQELKLQLEAEGLKPDILVSCIGGGSSFAGLCFPFLADKLAGKNSTRFVAVESDAVPSVTKGLFGYDHGDSAKLTPLMKMYTLGYGFKPPGIHAGGLRYHGLSPLVSRFIANGYAEAKAFSQRKIFEAAIRFARTEGIIPAPEAAHSIACAIDLASREKNRNIVFCLTGHGFFDLLSYEKYLGGKLEDSELPQAELDRSLGVVNDLNAPLRSRVAEPVEPRGAYAFGNSPTAPGPAVKGSPGFDTWWDRHFRDEKEKPGNQAKTNKAPPEGEGPVLNLKVISEAVVVRLLQDGVRKASVKEGCIITPLAKERAVAGNLHFIFEGSPDGRLGNP